MRPDLHGLRHVAEAVGGGGVVDDGGGRLGKKNGGLGGLGEGNICVGGLFVSPP